MLHVPSPPKALVGADAHAAFIAHVSELGARLSAQRQERETAARAARAASDAAALAMHRRHAGDPSAAEALGDAAASLRESLVTRDDDEPVFSNAAQQLAAAQAFDTFLITGTLGKRSSPGEGWQPTPPPAPRQLGVKAPRAQGANGPAYTDEEWLGGLISASHEIGRYAGVAATCGDTQSVKACCAVVGALHGELQGFDLRNGPLRRSFDSLK